jgi:5-methylcytosine-specific restriction endonuclease McrA
MRSKYCIVCNKKLLRKVRARGDLEATSQFESRKLCDNKCRGKLRSKQLKGKPFSGVSLFVKGHNLRFEQSIKTQFKKGEPNNYARRIPNGSNHYNWKGGITSKNEKIRKSKKYKDWRLLVFLRDDFTCTWCGSKKNIEADHIKPFSLFPELRFNINNGRTLCHDCHIKTDTYAGGVRKYNYVQSS